MLDNGSRDGSAQAARAHPAVDEVIALSERRGKALNDSELMGRARGRYALLLNEDSELLAGRHARAVAGAAEHARTRPARGRSCCARTVPQQACAWRFPTPLTALAGALFLHRLYTVQSRGARTREVDWCQSAALLVRREAAAQVGYMDPEFFVYSDEVDFARRLRDAGWRSLYVPSARAIHHEQLSTERRARAADRGAGAQPRPVHAQAPLARRRARGALADRVVLRAARARGGGAARTLAAAVLAARDRHAQTRARRGGCARRRMSTTARERERHFIRPKKPRPNKIIRPAQLIRRRVRRSEGMSNTSQYVAILVSEIIWPSLRPSRALRFASTASR